MSNLDFSHEAAESLGLTDDDEPIECIEEGNPRDPCRGQVELRGSLTGTGVPIPRCDHHWYQRLEREEEYRKFDAWGQFEMDPMDAGERWDDD